MGIRITAPGMLTTVQDLGRFGFMAQGFGPAGAMDSLSLRAANILVGNAPQAPALEFCLSGPTFEVGEQPTGEPLVAAFAGAAFQPTVNGAPVPLGVPILLHPGDMVKSGNATHGIYGYLALRGGVDVPLRFGSYSTSLKYHVGGYEGRALQRDDNLTCGNFAAQDASTRVLPPWLRITSLLATDQNQSRALRVVPHAQESFFTPAGIRTFYDAHYEVTPASDRMGLRLEGPEVESKNGSDIISDGIPLGAIQIPASGKPLIMMADRQTTGGYAKIGVVASADICALAQCPAGQPLHFVRTSVEEAQKTFRQQEDAFCTWANAETSPSQLLDHLQWQAQLRHLDQLEYIGPDHRATIEPYAIRSFN